MMFTTICTVVGAYVIAQKVVVPVIDAIDEKTKFSATLAYTSKKVVKDVKDLKKKMKKEQKEKKQ